jgi:hypothetical protein
MGFLQGRVSFLRFKTSGDTPRIFGPDQLEQLEANHIGRAKIASADGVESGWAAGSHILDLDFQLGKNVVGDALFFDMRIDKDAIPGDLKRAYYETELKALLKDSPTGKPSMKQKREAKQAAMDRLEHEAKDGRYRKRKVIPVVWNRAAGEVWFGATSLSNVDRFTSLFEKTFDIKLDAMPAGRQAFLFSEIGSRTRLVDDAQPSAFVPGVTPPDVAWIADETSRDFLGNEFLFWLWYYAEVESDTIKVADNSEITFMVAGSLALDCPRGQTGNDTFRHEGPSRLPEAKKAAQSGKIPRKMGLTLVRQGAQYELTLAAELLAVSGGKIPPIDEDVSGTDPHAVAMDRLGKLTDLVETLDLLYSAFLDRRIGPEWEDELAKMQKWLSSKSREASV